MDLSSSHVSSMKAAVQNVLDSNLAGTAYDPKSATEMCESISAKSAERVKALQLPYKIIVTTNVLEAKTRSGFHGSSSVVWDASADFSFVLRWRNEKLEAIVTVFCVSLD